MKRKFAFMNATRRDLEAQFERVVSKGWLSWFQREAKRAGTTTAHLLGIGSRETNLKNIKGDFRGGKHHGFGVMQVDIGTDAAYAKAWTPENVEPSIRRGVDIFIMKLRDTKNSVGKKVTVRSRTFVGREVDAEDLRRIATAAYNCGRWAHYHFSKGQNVDTTTTGDDYSRDVYDRAVEFADILEERGHEKMAIHRELELQGKYARQSHREQFGFESESERVKLPVGESQESQDELSQVDYERDSTAAHQEPSPSDDSVQAPGSISVEEPAIAGGVSAEPAPSAIPTGDPPEAKPSFFLKVEDYKEFVQRWLKRIWGVGISANFTQATGFVGLAAADSERWWIYLLIGGLIFVIISAVGLLLSIGLGILLWWNRKEIGGYITRQWDDMLNPNKKNYSLVFEKK